MEKNEIQRKLKKKKNEFRGFFQIDICIYFLAIFSSFFEIINLSRCLLNVCTHSKKTIDISITSLRSNIIQMRKKKKKK